ncbi:MAG: CBS domain-containing protein [Candidatus Aenigmarchaeota archaeon]|nr:CBS domain-containing protein [Candidatus Aenigmarchaeota archaeon]
MITGKYIKELRESARISQTDLAAMANISQAHIAKIETEKVNPRLSTVNTLLTILQRREKKTTCGDIMSRRIIPVKPHDNVKKAVHLMRSFGISQLPVMERGMMVGSISEGTVIKHMDRNPAYVDIEEIMDSPFPAVNEDDSLELLPDLLEFHPAVMVNKRGRAAGIITKADLLGAKQA